MKKRMISACAAFLLFCSVLSSCAVKETGAANREIIASLPETDAIDTESENWSHVAYQYGYAGMELDLPEGWEYNVEEYSDSESTFGISFWPEGQEEGTLCLRYYIDGFGVCGTGLSEEKITFQSGETAYIGTYDNKSVWDFISFRDAPGSYVLMNEGASAWWDEYKEEGAAILHTISLAPGVIRADQAVELAKEYCTVNYDMVRPDFDLKSGRWEIHFWTSKTTGDDQRVFLNADGDFLESIYGE